jgi:hypothetical protein
MAGSTVKSALNKYRISSLAWALAVDKTMKALREEPEVDFDSYSSSEPARILSGLDDDTMAGLLHELVVAGITNAAGSISPQWILAIWQASNAPLKVELVSRSGGTSTHSQVSLFEGRGLAIEFSRTVATAADGSVSVTGIGGVTNVTLFTEDVLWPVLAGSMPPFLELTATGSEEEEATDSPSLTRSPRIKVAAEEVARLVSGADDSETTVPTDVAAAIMAPKATVHLTVMAGAGDEGATASGEHYQSAAVWALAHRLYSVKTTGTDSKRSLVLVERPPGHIAQQLVWSVLGAHDFMSSRRSEESAS